jgi:hypothetical protein
MIVSGSKPMAGSFQRTFNDGTKEENNNVVDLARSI